MLRIFMVLFLMTASGHAMAYSYTLEITEQDLQQKLSALMPIEKQLSFFSVLISGPEVDLIPGSDRIAFSNTIAVRTPDGSKGTGEISISGSLSYDAASGSFYLHKPVVENIQVDRMPEQYAPDIKQIAQLLLVNALASHPVYTLKDSDLRQKYIKSVLESVAIEDGKLLVTLSAFQTTVH